MTSGTSRSGGPGRRPAAAAEPERAGHGRQRLVVELNRETAAELEALVETEGYNKTSIVNRALQMYAFLRRVERDGGQVSIRESAGAAPERIHFL